MFGIPLGCVRISLEALVNLTDGLSRFQFFDARLHLVVNVQNSFTLSTTNVKFNSYLTFQTCLYDHDLLCR